MPQGFGIDVETGERVRYPIFTFVDNEKYVELMEAIKIAGREFLAKLSMDELTKKAPESSSIAP